ncbi:MAG TPA: hypothetical protein VFR41_07855 [Acidimicrobiia bacterium]|nr:hypothetical protein [Acidimicrobiia bacterium]
MTPDAPRRAIVTLTLRQARRSAITWGVILAVLMLATAQGYQNLYPDRLSRVLFATTIGENTGFAALIGVPRRLDTTGGFVAWRTGIAVAVMLGLWSVLITTRLLRGEEDAGRREAMSSAPVPTRAVTLTVVGAIGLALCVPVAAALLSLLAVSGSAHVAVVDAAWLALAWGLVGAAFVACGAFVAQLAAPRIRATLGASGVLAAAYLVRMVADSQPRFGWLRWATPLGWFEEAHLFGGTRPAVLLLLVTWSVVFLIATAAVASRRDIGAALLNPRTRVEARASRLGAPLTDAYRFTRSALIGWALVVSLVAFVLGLLAPGAAKAIAESDVQSRLPGFFGTATITPAVYLGLMFAILIAALVALSPAAHVTNLREEEASGRLENVLAGVVSRRRWLWSRAMVATVAALLLALLGALFGWLGQRAAGGTVGVTHLIAATLPYVPLGLLFGAVGLAVFGVAPRLTQGLVPTLIGIAILDEIVGRIVQAPSWVLDLSPFFHLGNAPGEPARWGPAVLMLAVATVLAVFGVEAFTRRDLAAE